MSRKEQRGFSIIELAIVLIVLAIVTALTLPHFLPPPSRPPFIKVRSEFRSLAVALESYYIDNTSYPPAINENGRMVPFTKGAYSSSTGFVPWLLTTPIIYMKTIPFDPYGPNVPRNWSRTYRYATNGKGCWILASVGPDEDEDMDPAYYVRDASGDITQFLTQFSGSYVEFDPTNGSISNGDVYRTGP